MPFFAPSLIQFHVNPHLRPGNTHPRSIILPPSWIAIRYHPASSKKRSQKEEILPKSAPDRVSGNPARNRAPLCPCTGEKTLCHLRFRRRGCARRPGLDTLCLFGLEEAVPPSQVCDWNRYSIQKTLGSLEFPREQWRPTRPSCPRNGATYFAPY